jgi:hypothetical protein
MRLKSSVYEPWYWSNTSSIQAKAEKTADIIMSYYISRLFPEMVKGALPAVCVQIPAAAFG